MPVLDPRIDAYIAKSAPFAQPILIRLRRAIHKGCPEVVETLKWSVPAFEYNGILCGMAAFKAHCLFNLWKAQLVKEQGLPKPAADALDRIGRLESVKDLPSDAVLVQIIKKAAAVNKAGLKAPRVAKAAKAPARMPADLKTALARRPTAVTAFASMSPSHRREFIEWITEAKGADTRARRVAQTVTWVTEGKSRNWKYERQKN